jgi:hypothetical protein
MILLTLLNYDLHRLHPLAVILHRPLCLAAS